MSPSLASSISLTSDNADLGSNVAYNRIVSGLESAERFPPSLFLRCEETPGADLHIDSIYFPVGLGI